MTRQSASKRILLMIDDIDERDVAEKTLKKEGYSVDQAATLEQCAESLNRNVPDVILLDVNLQKTSGVKIAKRLKSHPKTAHIPVVVLTGLNERKSLQPAILEHDIDFYMMKPLDSGELVEKIQEAISCRSNNPQQ